MEFRSEGRIMGVGAQMFVVAGPVLVYGISSTVLVGLYIFIDEVIDMARKLEIKLLYWIKGILKEGVCIVGPKEKEGPLGKYFDQKENEDFERTLGKGEARFVEATYANYKKPD